MTYTTNYSLKKPAVSDPVLIADLNSNMDTIDTNIATSLTRIVILEHQKSLIAVRATNLVGAQTVTFGFQPKFVKIRAGLSVAGSLYDSDGNFNGTEYNMLFHYGTATSGSNYNNTFIIFLHSGAEVNQATCAFTATGIVLTWSASGLLPACNILMKIEAI